MSKPQVRSYEVGVKGTDWQRIVYALSAGKAKYEYLMDVRESWQNVSFKDLTCRSVRSFRQTDHFERTAKYRGVPGARIGMEVKAGGCRGVLVGSNDSANFDVLFLEGPAKGQTGNVHPGSIKFPEGCR